MNKNNKRKINITKILFGIYCVLIVWLILFKLSFSIEDFIGLDKNRSINLIPCYYDTEVNMHFKEVIANILIFIPFGIYLKMLDKDNKKIFLYGFIFSSILEASQFIFKLGATDITDLIANTLGTIIGILGYVVIERIFKNKEKINKVLNILALIGTILLSLLTLLLFVFN